MRTGRSSPSSTFENACVSMMDHASEAYGPAKFNDTLAKGIDSFAKERKGRLRLRVVHRRHRHTLPRRCNCLRRRHPCRRPARRRSPCRRYRPRSHRAAAQPAAAQPAAADTALTLTLAPCVSGPLVRIRVRVIGRCSLAHTRRRLLTTLTPDAHFWPGDRAQDEQPTLQGGPSHTGAHDAHNSHRAVP